MDDSNSTHGQEQQQDSPVSDRDSQSTLVEFWELDEAAEIVEGIDRFDESSPLDASDADPQISASDFNSDGVWSPMTRLAAETETTTSSRSRADASGKVVLTFVFPMELSHQEQAYLRNYISEAQSIRRHAAHVMRSFAPDDWGKQSPIYRVLKESWDSSRTSILSGNVSENMNKVGQAFAAWEANGYREQGADPPQYGSKQYVAIRGDSVKNVWKTDGGRYGIDLQLGKTQGEVHDPGRDHTFSVLLDYGPHQAKAIDAIYEETVDPGSAEVHERDGDWFLHQTISYEQPVYDWKDVNRWAGIDLGTASLYALAVVDSISSESSPKGNGIDVLATGHGPGRELMHERRQQQAALRHLQQEYGYTVASEQLGKRLSRHSIDLEHHYANDIVSAVDEYAPAGIVFEDLMGIKGLGWSNLWSYFRFKQIVSYKAHKRGIPVITLTKGQTRGTSQECSVCSHNPHYDPDGGGVVSEKTGETGRITRAQYRCDQCGYGPIDADTNAAINIARRLIEE